MLSLMSIKRYYYQKMFVFPLSLSLISRQVEEIFDKAFSNFPTMRITSEYLDVMNQFYEEELIVSNLLFPFLFPFPCPYSLTTSQTEAQMRTAFEKSITICGLDIYDGATIWSRYKDFEYEELDDSLEMDSSAEAIQEGKKRLVNIFRRQLAQPLNDNESVLQNLDICLSQMFVESDVDLINPTSISTAFQTGLELREVRLPFEDNTHSDQFHRLTEDLRASRWLTYIEFEIKDNQIFRAQRLYERAVLDCRQIGHLWMSYVYFALHRVKNWTLLESILLRAVKIESCKQNIEFWKIKFLSIELITHPGSGSGSGSSSTNQMTDSESTLTLCSSQVYNTFQLCLQIKFVNQNHYWVAMKMYCDHYKRSLIHLVTNGSREVDLLHALNTLWSALDYVEYYLINYFSEWIEGWLLYLHYRLNCEENVIESICQSVDGQLENTPVESKSELVWDRIIQKFPKSYPMWKAYLQWAHTTNKELTFCRKLYKKALVVLDEKPVPCVAINPYSQYAILVSDSKKLINPHEELLAQWIGYEEECGTVAEVMPLLVKWNKQSFDFNHLSFGVTKQEPLIAKQKKRDLPSSVNEVIPSKKMKSEQSLNEDQTQESGSTSVLTEVNSSQIPQVLASSPPLYDGLTYSIFVKNLPFTATETSLREVFDHCGQISLIQLITSQAGKSKGMAQIDFISEDAVKKALLLHNSPLHERPMIIQRFRGEGNAVSNSKSSFHPTTLFISKIPKEATDDDLRQCFSKLGNIEIVACKIAVDKRSGTSKVDLLSCLYLMINRGAA
jgi:hypothetical protein